MTYKFKSCKGFLTKPDLERILGSGVLMIGDMEDVEEYLRRAGRRRGEARLPS